MSEDSIETNWEGIAVHALADLHMMGVQIEKMIDMTPAILEKVDVYLRDASSYS